MTWVPFATETKGNRVSKLTRWGALYLSLSDFARMGSPSHVAVLVDREQRRVGLAPSRDGSGIRVTPILSSPPGPKAQRVVTHYVIGVSAPINRAFNWPDMQDASIHLEDTLLVIQLPDVERIEANDER